MRTLGIDPGLDGAFAVIEQSAADARPRIVECDVLPLVQTLQGKNQVDARKLSAAIDRYRTGGLADFTMAAIEQVHARKGEGPVGAFTFGRTVGRLETVLLLKNIVFVEPTPQTWKRVVLTGSGVTLKSDKESQKEAAIRYVRQMFPDFDLRKTPRCKTDHDGKAEAVCLALYALKYASTTTDITPKNKGGTNDDSE